MNVFTRRGIIKAWLQSFVKFVKYHPVREGVTENIVMDASGRLTGGDSGSMTKPLLGKRDIKDIGTQRSTEDMVLNGIKILPRTFVPQDTILGMPSGMEEPLDQRIAKSVIVKIGEKREA